MIVPSAAIQTGNAGAFVYVVQDDQTVVTRKLTLGVVVGEQVAVLEGLKVAEQVVVEGADRLRENAKVKVLNPNNASNKKPPLSSLEAYRLPSQHG
jgi:multidrug efflux system membrane fusion protein